MIWQFVANCIALSQSKRVGWAVLAVWVSFLDAQRGTIALKRRAIPVQPNGEVHGSRLWATYTMFEESLVGETLFLYADIDRDWQPCYACPLF